jgi:hypothetical protein
MVEEHTARIESLKSEDQRLQKELDEVEQKLKEQKSTKRERKPSMVESSTTSPAEMEQRTHTLKKIKEVKEETRALEDSKNELKLKIKMLEAKIVVPDKKKPSSDLSSKSDPVPDANQNADDEAEAQQNTKLLRIMIRRCRRMIHNYRTRWEEEKRLRKLKLRVAAISLGEAARRGTVYAMAPTPDDGSSGTNPVAPFAQTLNAFAQPGGQAYDEHQRRAAAEELLQVLLDKHHYVQISMYLSPLSQQLTYSRERHLSCFLLIFQKNRMQSGQSQHRSRRMSSVFMQLGDFLAMTNPTQIAENADSIATNIVQPRLSRLVDLSILANPPEHRRRTLLFEPPQVCRVLR